MRIIILCIWFLLLLNCQGKPGAHKGSIPSFDLITTDSLTHVKTNEIKDGTPVVLLYFSPDCEHCQHETKDILSHMDSLRNVQFYFITNDSLDKIRAFRSVYQLDRYSNIVLGWDNQFLFPRIFKGAFPPYLVIYDRTLKQLGTFDGSMDVSKLISLVNY